ncbi:hypothetical protein CEXT_642621 [Caerostris extrusa]|uniref:Uncharacterized protein n=1 Tax=Caerostris extrusa TaxID=172846 RepID=A0AAV4S3L2_CAEEX|nr:hypothetical protein CEXT_642621 [Caerostris extrusa]
MIYLKSLTKNSTGASARLSSFVGATDMKHIQHQRMGLCTIHTLKTLEIHAICTIGQFVRFSISATEEDGEFVVGLFSYHFHVKIMLTIISLYQGNILGFLISEILPN